MTSKSAIEWTDHTWNPTTGCSKISSGCKYCYAEVMARRLKMMGAPGYENGFRLVLHKERLQQPIQRSKPTVYFVNSMSDLFHENIPDSFLDEVFSIIQATPHHTYQILTKRSDRLPKYFSKRICPPNVWLGVTVENCAEGLPRIDHLRKVNVQVRFLSIEPLLEDLGDINLKGIQWVIVGGESGSNARIMLPKWVKNIKIQSDRVGAAFFFKQWGGWGSDGVKRHKKENGRLLLGKTWDALPLPVNL